MAMPAFEITANPGRNLLRITVRGLWDTATVERFVVEVDHVLAGMAAEGCAPERLVALVDARAHGVQPLKVIDCLKEALSTRTARARRVAVLVDGAVHRMQVERTQPSGHDRVFGSETEAMAWLIEP